MNYQERFIKEVSDELGIDKRVVEEIIRSCISLTKAEIESGEFGMVKLPNFGSFRIKEGLHRKRVRGKVDLLYVVNRAEEKKREKGIKYSRGNYNPVSKEDIIAGKRGYWDPGPYDEESPEVDKVPGKRRRTKKQ